MRVHFVGIGGIGMSAIAKVMLEEGHEVSGSDLKLSPITDALSRIGAIIFQGHSEDNLGRVDLVVVSSAVSEANPELQAARERRVTVVKRAEMLGRLMKQRAGIAIAGTHGKTTTSALIAHTLEKAGLDPTILVGGEMLDIGSNAKLGKGRYLVAEADEFDGSFLHLEPQIAVVTNVEPEHLDYYKSFNQAVDAFHQFIESVPEDGQVIICGDDPQLNLIKGYSKATVSTYGFGEGADWRATSMNKMASGSFEFDVEHRGSAYRRFRIGITGEHNVLNALAAVVVNSIIGIAPEITGTALASFRGVKRRFEIKGEMDGIIIVDDYAHHPTEIRATLKAAKERFGDNRIVAVFQPHTYSRTKFLFQEFTFCFGDADEVIITDTYAAREKDEWGISSADLADALHHSNVRYIASLQDAAQTISHELNQGDVLITIGAGDVHRVGEKVMEELKAR